MPTFSFLVEIDGVATHVIFQEASGIDTSAQPIEYRRGARMPGLRTPGTVTLKRGVFAKDARLFEWLNNSTRRSTVTIKLVDEAGNPTMTWRLTNAWPVKFSSADLKAGANEVAIESIELAHEGLTIAAN
jgi:phage tail-like protein